jgi:hypothetical protein
MRTGTIRATALVEVVKGGPHSMERSHHPDVTAVSRFWTPDHLDVTDVPMTYARPKPPWIDHLERRSRSRIDDRDRLARRRMHSGAVIDPSEIPVLPPLAAAAQPAHAPLLTILYDAVTRLFPNRRIAV